MNSFHKKIFDLINVPVEKISFRKDKWGELCTIYFGALPSISIGDDNEDIECFLETVKQHSLAFVHEAKKIYGNNWTSHIKYRKP